MASWSARHSPRLGRFGQLVLLWTLVELWLLNVADLLLTRYSLWLGFAKESNGVMDYFFRSGTVPTVAFKMLTGIFAAVVVYQALWVLSF
jgi:hypothetical protein